MQVIVAGGTGFVGRHLCRHLLEAGYGVTALGSKARAEAIRHPDYRYVAADTTRGGPWQDVLADADVVVNLAGRSIFKRWTRSYKQALYDSRILTTRNLAAGLPAQRAALLLSASAIGYYGEGGEQVLRESQPAGHDFLANLSRDWEAAARDARTRGVRVAVMRFGVVLGRDGGALRQMVPAFRLGAGGPLGNGRQWFSWIHLDDLAAAILFLIGDASAAGAYNFCAPQPVRNRELAATLGKILRRPAVIPVPAAVLRLALGEFAQTLLASQRVVPLRLQQAGFEFQFPTLESALRDLV